ncbi:MAG: aldo/keto reductase [Acidimicrobiia bacterium]
MELRSIAHLQIPVIGMGTSETFDVEDGQIPSRRALTDTLLAAGGALFDSSPMYGKSERALGEALGDRRSEAIIATKVWTEDDGEAARQIAASLRFYGGKVELFQIHNLVQWETRLRQLEEQRELGTISSIGATHWRKEAFDDLEVVMRTGRIEFVQIPYNPIEREVEQRILPLAADLGLGVLIMRPFAKASLLGAAPSAEELAPLAAFGVHSWPQALLKWGLSDLRTTASIPATSRPERAADHAAAGSGPWLDAEARELVARLARPIG